MQFWQVGLKFVEQERFEKKKVVGRKARKKTNECADKRAASTEAVDAAK